MNDLPPYFNISPDRAQAELAPPVDAEGLQAIAAACAVSSSYILPPRKNWVVFHGGAATEASSSSATFTVSTPTQAI